MVKVKIKNVQKYIEQFDIEKILFKDIGPAIKARGYIKFDEFYKICMWKSTRSKPRYVSEYNQKNIKKISKNADDESVPVKDLKKDIAKNMGKMIEINPHFHLCSFQ